MFKKINLQYLISYLGTLPFIIVILDKFFLYQLDPYIMQDFIIYYSIIIFVFIGSINWNFKKKVPNYLIIYGFLPSVYSLILIILNLYLYNIKILILLSVILLITQLFFDFFLIFVNLKNKNFFYFLRLPLTILISLILIIIMV